MTDTPIDRWEGTTGAFYFVNPNDPDQDERMKTAFFDSWDHAINAWKPIVDYLTEAMKGTDFPEVAIEHTGGGVWCLYAYPNREHDEEQHFIILGPVDVDPEPESAHLEETAAYQHAYDDHEGTSYQVTDVPLNPADLYGYAKKLAETLMKCVNDPRRHEPWNPS